MKVFSKLTMIAIPIVAGLSVLASCGAAGSRSDGSADAEEDAKDQAVVVRDSTVREALVTFLTGEVRKIAAGEETFPEIGDTVVPGDLLVTGDDGFIELQLGGVGAVSIQPGTEYRLEILEVSEDSGKVSGTLSLGALLAKVRRLSGDDAFEVNVPGAVCAVRGTEFLVRADERRSVTLAVSQGAVAVVPPSLAKGGSNNPDELDGVRSLMPLVDAGEELELEPDAMAGAERAVAAWNSRNAGGEEAEAGIAELEEAVAGILSESPVPTPMAAESAEVLDEAIPEILPAAAGTPGAEASAEDTVRIELVSMTVRTEPSDATIYLNGRKSGRGTAARLFEKGASVAVKAVTDAGEETERIVVAGEEAIVELRIEAGEPFEDPEADAPRTGVSLSSGNEATAESAELVIGAEPRDARIAVNGTVIGTGSAAYAGSAGERVRVTVSRPGYASETREANLDAGTTPMDVELDRRIIVGRTKLPEGAVGQPVSSGGYAVAAGAGGTVMAVDGDGKLAWSRETGNTGGEKTAPMIAGGRVYVTGNRELAIIDLATGNLAAAKELRGDRSDLFGRRPLAMGDRVVLPSDSALVFLNPATGDELGSMAIPQGSRMSPAAWNGEIIIADQRGTLLFADPSAGSITGTVATDTTQPIAQAPAVGPGGIAVFAGRKGTVAAVDLAGKRVLWTRALGTGVRIHTDAVIEGNVAYVYGGDAVYALDMGSGRDVFPAVTGVSAPPLAAEGLLYLCRGDGSLEILDGRSGSTLAGVPLGERVEARPAAIGNMVVVFGESSAILIDPRSFRR